jgi:hypothetical protein
MRGARFRINSHAIGAFPGISIGVTKPTEFAAYENIEHSGGAVGKLPPPSMFRPMERSLAWRNLGNCSMISTS